MLKKTILAGVALMLVLPLSGFANHGGQGKHHGQPSLEEKFYHKFVFFLSHTEDLQLTEDQRNALLDIKSGIERKKIETSAAADVFMHDVYTELRATTSDLEKINTLIDGKMEVKRAFTKDVAKAIVGMKNLLTPEQLTKAKELYMKEMFSSAGGHGKMGCCRKGH